MTKTKIQNGEKVRIIPLVPTITQKEVKSLCSQNMIGTDKGIHEMFMPLSLPISCVYDSTWNYFKSSTRCKVMKTWSTLLATDSQTLIDKLTIYPSLSEIAKNEVDSLGFDTNRSFVVVSESAYQLLSTIDHDGIKSKFSIHLETNYLKDELDRFARFESGMRRICQIYLPIADGQKDNSALRLLAEHQLNEKYYDEYYEKYYRELDSDESICCPISKKIIKKGQTAVLIPFFTNFEYNDNNPLNRPFTRRANSINSIGLAPIEGEYAGGSDMFVPNLALGGDDHLHAIESAFKMSYNEVIHSIINHNLILPGGIKMGCMIVDHAAYFEMIHRWQLSEVDDVAKTTMSLVDDTCSSEFVYRFNLVQKNDFVESWNNFYNKADEFYDIYVKDGSSMRSVGVSTDISFLQQIDTVLSPAAYIIAKVYLNKHGRINAGLVNRISEMCRFNDVLGQLNLIYFPNIAGVADQNLVIDLARLTLQRTKRKSR